MLAAKIRELATTKAKVARLQRWLNNRLPAELAALPKRYGFRSTSAFVRAVCAARTAMTPHNHAAGAEGQRAPDSALDGLRRVLQFPRGVHSARPFSSRKITTDRASSAPMRAADLFAGAGGFSLASRNLGIRVVAAVESSRSAAVTYRTNFVQRRRNAPKLYEQDLTTLDPAVLARDCFPAGSPCDIIMGGPPCQGFSVHRINGAGVDDPRNGLLLSYFGFVRALAPKVFVLENVPGMLWPRHAEYVKRFYALANESGYDVEEPAVLNAKDFGVPQNRKRVFIIGVKRGLSHTIVWPPAVTHFDPESDKVKKEKLPAWRIAREVFAEGLRKNDPNRTHMRSCEALVDVFRRTPKNGGSRDQSGRKLACHLKHDGHSDVYGRINPDLPGPTMTTACINPSKGRFVHPRLDHGIAARHAARFQGFPEDFVFAGGLMSAGVQIGNAVPIPLGEAVLRSVMIGIAATAPAVAAA